MKTTLSAMLTGLLLAGLAVAAPAAHQKVQPFPGTLINARYVYVTSYEGGQFDPNLRPEERQAIVAVQNALQKWGKFILVYKPQEADMILVVDSYPSEDILAVYDGHGWPRQNFLWRAMGPGGLQAGETPLLTELRQAFERAAK
ncbi:MAG TPA: hypothetical protein VLV49_12665 [Terriglobales bacterium]|nr:hypothetical protein [Terriglobales bacterium]